MYYPDDLVAEVRARNDIVDVIGQYVKLTKSSGRYMGLCPFHSDKNPSFSVNPDSQMYYCFGCHASGDVYTFLMEYNNATFPEAVQMLAQRVGMTLPEGNSASEKREHDLRSNIFDVNLEAAKYFYYRMRKDSDQTAYSYLTGRGLNDDTIDAFGLGYASPRKNDLYQYLRGRGYSDDLLGQTGLVNISERECTDAFINRVMFPIRDVSGHIVGFGGRALGEGKPKYKNTRQTPVFDKSATLYNLNQARRCRDPYLIVCEGYMDVITLYQAGFHNAVACLGVAMTQEHAQLLKRCKKQIILLYDDDEAGTKATLRAIPVLKDAGLSVKVPSLKPFNDPDDFLKGSGPEALRERIESAVGSFQYEIAQLYRDYDMTDPAGKTDFQRAVARRLCEFPMDLERNNYLEAVCAEYGIPADGMRRLVADEARQMGGITSEVAQAPPVQKREERKGERENTLFRSQKLLLTGLMDRPELFSRIGTLLSPEDFEGDLYRRVARMVWDQLGTGMVNPAGIIDHFINDEGEYKEVSDIFHTWLSDNMSEQEQKKTLEETALRIRRNSLNEQAGQAKDAQTLQQILREQADLRSWHL